MDIDEIANSIVEIDCDFSLREAARFARRAAAIDYIDFHIIDRIEAVGREELLSNKLVMLKQRAEKLRTELEKIDEGIFKQLREKIRAGKDNDLSFMDMIQVYLRDEFSNDEEPEKVGYNFVDDFINGLLSNQPIPEASLEREEEMVFYQKTPASVVFEMASMADFRQDDVFFDIGSGLGQVVMLINLISKVRARGIEFEPAFCFYARETASQLNLSGVEFFNTNAHYADYSTGTVFFLYTPFKGRIWEGVIEQLKNVSLKKEIRLFTYGPCSLYTKLEDWLYCLNGHADDPYKLYLFKSR